MIFIAHWLHDLLHWLKPINSGDLATWVTGILTGGSLILGFGILRSDRRKEEQAQAARVVVWGVDTAIVPGKSKSIASLTGVKRKI